MPINWTDQLKPLGTDHDYWRLIRGRDVDITEAHSALTTLEDADIFLVDEAAAGNLTSTKKIASSDMKTYFQSGVLPLTGGTMTGTLVLDNTGVTAAPSAAGKFLAVAAASYVDNDTSSGETAAQNFYGTRFSLHAIRPSSGSITTTDAATVYIEGATTAGTGQTITNNYALQLGAGDVKLPDDGKILFGNANEYIKGDGTDLIISSTGHIDFNSTRVHSIGRLTLDISGSAVDIIRDEDDMASDDDQALATQQSIKAYVDAQILTEDTIAELNDTTISSADDGHFLVHTGSAWVNEAPATALASLGINSTATELNIMDGVQSQLVHW